MMNRISSEFYCNFLHFIQTKKINFASNINSTNLNNLKYDKEKK